MIRQCAWCGKILSGIPQPGPSLISHSICRACLDELIAECSDGSDRLPKAVVERSWPDESRFEPVPEVG
jgi:hypothetical protein